MNRPKCGKCGGKLVYETYPMEEMLVRKCFTCGKIDSYHELSRAESQRLFRRVDAAVAAPRLAS